MRTDWFLRFFLTSMITGALSATGTCFGSTVFLNWTQGNYWIFPGSVIIAGISISCGIVIGLFFGVIHYKDVSILRNMRKHMLLYWMYWIGLGGVFSLMGCLFLLVPALALAIA